MRGTMREVVYFQLVERYCTAVSELNFPFSSGMFLKIIIIKKSVMEVFNLVFTVIFIANCQRMNVLPQIKLATKSLDQSNNFNGSEYD